MEVAPLRRASSLYNLNALAFSALTLLVGKGIRPVKNGGWALVSTDGVAPSRMVGVFASVNLPLHHKVQKCSLLAQAHWIVTEKGHKIGCGSPCFVHPIYTKTPITSASFENM